MVSRRFLECPIFNAQSVPLQSQIPTSGNPLCFILNPAKTQLSSFRMAQGYPVVAHCANLPTSIQNGNGFGGGHIVGWLPIVKEDLKETNKPEFIAHKCMVLHQAFLMIIQSIIVLSKSGCWLECGDGVKQWLFPTVLMLSGDYKEQTVMALTHRSNAKFPCPRCLADHAELSDIMKTWPLRTATETHKLVTRAQNTTCAQDHEVLLSTQGVHNVNNVFWNLPLMDPHHTQSFDRLHFNNSSLFGYHFWGMFKTLIEGYGCQQVVQLDAHLMQEYIDASMLEATEDDPAKKWNFPKMHVLVHSFDNIKILQIEHITFMSVLIHSQIDEIDKLNTNTLTPKEESPTHPDLLPASLSTAQGQGLWGKVFYNKHISLHLQQPLTILLSFGDSFHICLAKWLTAELEASNEGGKEMSYAIELSPSDNIHEDCL
ncbi:hypothetical protein EI94DRAFT_1709249 [Lactarius quietus]|nr:hypothetical protein EI94DRAFT_1709249 [Lactarius quietus]